MFSLLSLLHPLSLSIIQLDWILFLDFMSNFIHFFAILTEFHNLLSFVFWVLLIFILLFIIVIIVLRLIRINLFMLIHTVEWKVFLLLLIIHFVICLVPIFLLDVLRCIVLRILTLLLVLFLQTMLYLVFQTFIIDPLVSLQFEILWNKTLFCHHHIILLWVFLFYCFQLCCSILGMLLLHSMLL